MSTSKRVISVLLAVVIVLTTLATMAVTTASAATATISYSFTNTKAGYAQGTITVTPSSGNFGTYYLYWADDTKALADYGEIATLTISSGSGKYTMPAYTAIPADATKVIAFKASSEPAVANRTVAKASAVYNITASKQLSFDAKDALYTFGAISDPQLANDSYGEGRYPYDEQHLAAALETLAKRGVDFTVSSGDTVNDQNGNQTYMQEYRRYQRILADSSYANPIYEANGNHEEWADPNTIGIPTFIKETGLDSVKSTLTAGKPYFEITEPTTGDHFIFMALEGAFHSNTGVQFSTAQLNWLEGLLKKYKDDGKNFFILEHANVEGWGSGDKATAPFYYDLGLKKNYSDVQRFIKLMETYKDCVIITGHTHLELGAQLNYSDNGGTSSVMMHNSAIGGVRRLVNGSVDRTPVLGLSEGYIVEVYEDCIIFGGTNLYHNETMPSCTYIIPLGTSAIEPKPTEPKPTTTEPTEPTTVKPTTKPTQPKPSTTEPTEPTTVKPTTKPTQPKPSTTEPTEPTTVKPTTKPTQPKPSTTEPTEPTTVKPTTKPTVKPTEKPTQPVIPTSTAPAEKYLYGDADLDEKVTIKDATFIQKISASLAFFSDKKGFKQADVNADGLVNIKDATSIQKYLASIIFFFPAETVKTQLVSVGASLNDTLASVSKDLESYYTFSSYDQYMALKKAFIKYKTTSANNSAIVAELTEKQQALYDIAGEPPQEGGEITIYFTNNENWSTVNAYIWGTAGTKSSWPGSAMKYVGTNDMSQKVYSVTFSYSDYQNIIFNNGSTQTVDIALSGANNVGYYLSGESGGKKTCSTYDYTG